VLKIHHLCRGLRWDPKESQTVNLVLYDLIIPASTKEDGETDCCCEYAKLIQNLSLSPVCKAPSMSLEPALGCDKEAVYFESASKRNVDPSAMYSIFVDGMFFLGPRQRCAIMMLFSKGFVKHQRQDTGRVKSI
jgi:hypothetical protein